MTESAFTWESARSEAFKDLSGESWTEAAELPDPRDTSSSGPGILYTGYSYQMRLSPETSFPGVVSKQARLRGIGGGWGRETLEENSQFSPIVLFTSTPNKVR